MRSAKASGMLVPASAGHRRRGRPHRRARAAPRPRRVCHRKQDRIRLKAAYNAGVFDGDRITHLLQDYDRILAAVAADPDRKIAAL